MKKIKMILFIVLMMLFAPRVYAADGVAIESVSLDSKSANAIIVSDATIDGLTLKVDVKFDDINDFVKYKLIVKNSTASSFELTESTSSSSYITYEYGYEDGSKVLPANSSKTMYITIKYSNAVPVAAFSGGNYTETKSFSINLEDGTDEITVPSTIDGLYCYLVLLIGTLVFSIALLKATKNKKYLVLVLSSIVLIPMNINAIEKLKITIESKVEINNPNEITPVIYWAIQENGTTEGIDYDTSDPRTVSAYKLVISNKALEGVHSGSFSGTDEFTIDYINHISTVPWMTDDDLLCYINEVKVEGRVVPTSTALWFADLGYGITSEVTFDLASLNTANVTNMSEMFSYAGDNSSTFNLDLSSFDTSNVTDMSRMFSGVGGNLTSFNLDLSSFDTANVTNMSEMFSYAGYNSLTFNLNISSFNTSKVTNMFLMFINTALDATERVIILPGTNGNGINNTPTIIYGADELVNADINLAYIPGSPL